MSQVTRYSQLGRNTLTNDDRYVGVWRGEEVTFNRIYKGRRLTDDECARLCRGETLTVKASHSGLSEYEMTVGLDGREFIDSRGRRQIMVTIKPVSRDFDMVSRVKDAEFSHPRPDRMDYFSNDDDARIAAMLSYEMPRPDVVPTRETISTDFGKMPVYKVYFPVHVNGQESAGVSDELVVENDAFKMYGDALSNVMAVGEAFAVSDTVEASDIAENGEPDEDEASNSEAFVDSNAAIPSEDEYYRMVENVIQNIDVDEDVMQDGDDAFDDDLPLDDVIMDDSAVDVNGDDDVNGSA